MGSYMSAEEPTVDWSVLKAEVIQLGEDFEVALIPSAAEGSCQRAFDRCRKNPGHKDMVTLDKFSLDDIPAPWRFQELYEFVNVMARSVCKIRVGYVSWRRPVKYAFGTLRGKKVFTVGTGCVFLRGEDLQKAPIDCPLKRCDKPRPHKVTPIFEVQTATHVVFDDLEAEESVFEFFYESESDLSKVVTAHGVKVLRSRKGDDQCTVLCVSHDLALFEKILLEPFQLKKPPRTYQPPPMSPPEATKTPLVMTISHPHGHIKHVSFGEWVGYKMRAKSMAEQGGTTVKEWVELVESVAPNWMEEGVYLGGAYVSTDHVREMKRKAELHPESTLADWAAGAESNDLAFITYSTMTCPGSSGSSMFVIVESEGKGWDWAIITSHFRHFRGKTNASGSVDVRVQHSEAVREMVCLLRDEGFKLK